MATGCDGITLATKAARKFARYHAEDAAQETLATAWERFGRLDAEAVVKVARDVCTNTRYASEHPLSGAHPRTLAEHPVVCLDIRGDLDAAPEAPPAFEWSPGVAKALGRLTDAQRDAVVAVHGQGLTMTEFAALLGVSKGAVSNRVAKAKRKLREELQRSPLG